MTYHRFDYDTDEVVGLDSALNEVRVPARRLAAGLYLYKEDGVQCLLLDVGLIATVIGLPHPTPVMRDAIRDLAVQVLREEGICDDDVQVTDGWTN